VCYDVRFPEFYRALAPMDLILVPSAFTATTGRAHWETLLRARAIENLAWVLAPAQGGTHASGRQTHGHSMVVDPWGKVVAERATGAGVVMADIDPGSRRGCAKPSRPGTPVLKGAGLIRANRPHFAFSM
jgi:nitrilase